MVNKTLTLRWAPEISDVPDVSALNTRRAKRVLAWLGGIAVLFVAAWFGVKAWLVAYLHGPEFQRFVQARLGETLRAEVDCAPLRFEGFDVFCDGIKARGYEGAAFADARVEQVRARFSLRKIFARAWEIEHIDAERVAVKLDGSRLVGPKGKSEMRNAKAESGWLPNRLEVAQAKVREVEIAWGDLPSSAGALRGVAVRARPVENGWDFDGEGGALVAAGLPPLDVATLRLRQRGTVLFVNEAKFNGRAGGSAVATGEVDFAKALDLRARLDGIDMAPFLADDWRARLHGKMTGDIRVESALPGAGPPLVSGSLRLDGARIEALPVLDQIAVFTRTAQFRQLALTRVSGDFHRDATRLEVTKLLAESEGRLRVEGGFITAQGQIDGTFQVGVPPSLLAWLPGAQERVFTTARDGYVWTTMRLTGPVEAPSEDLSARLVAAAGEVVLEKVEGVTRDAIQTGKDAVKSALDLLVPLFK